MVKYFKRLRARLLTNRAFFLVEHGDFESATEVLKRAVAVDPTYGHAHNELASVYGKSGQLDLGEEAAVRAIHCDPQNPKFYNALLGIRLDRVKRLKMRKDVRSAFAQRLKDIEHSIAEHPDYPPLRLAKAVALALGGAPQNEWDAELAAAADLYRGRSYAASGLRLYPGDIDQIILRNRSQCLEMVRHVSGLPEE